MKYLNVIFILVILNYSCHQNSQQNIIEQYYISKNNAYFHSLTSILLNGKVLEIL